MKVTIKATVDNYFLPAIGFGDTQVIGASALAEYEGQVAMGSPENSVGNDPEDSSATQPDFNLGVEGPGYTKVNGDRFQPNNCGGSGVSYCNSSASGIQNEEFDQNGYFFAVEVLATHGEDLLFEVFDAAYVSSSDGNNATCDYVPLASERTSLRALTASADYNGVNGGTIPHGWYSDFSSTDPDISKVDVDTRFQTGRNVWCVGDQNSTSDVLNTQIIVREPDATPWNPLDNPVVTQAGCQPASFTGSYVKKLTSSSGSSIYELLDPTNTTYRSQMQWSVDTTDSTWTLAETWRRWARVCTIPAAYVEPGKYLIQVTTTHSTVNPEAYDATANETGLNAFSLRAGFDNGTGTPVSYDDIRMYAEGNLPIFANSDAANPEFHLARVLEVGRERTLTVEIFDIGDAGSLSMQVIASADSNMAATGFSGCSFELEGYSGTPSGANASNCSVSTTSSFNGRVLLIQVPIPDSYTCDDTSGSGCWIKLRMNGTDIHDFTTWSAYISGDPVRLIE
jgi:hypothetical protein